MQKTNTTKTHFKRIFFATAIAIVLSITTALALQYKHNAVAISTETRPTLVGREIHMGPNGGQVKMTGVNVWGIETITMDGFGDDQYADRVNVVNTVKSWGANHVRFRLQASDYNNETYMTKAEYLNRIVEWRNLVTAAGMYFMPVWWDGHDGPYSGANWGADYDQAFPMMTDVVNALGNDPMVFYEPFNEPTGAVSDIDWLNGMKDTVRHFREDIGYTGILLVDPRVWSHCYEDWAFDELEQYDASLDGMNGTHQIIFTKHDYAREFTDPDAGFDPSEWPTNSGGCGTWDFTQHAVWESEFGNYSGDPSSVHLPWSQGAADWMHDKVDDSTLAGATAFLFGPWLDENATTGPDNITKTTWGGYVDDIFLTPFATLNGIGTLGSLIFFDKNKDGVYNAGDGDTGIGNVTVAVYDNLDNNCSVTGGDTPLLTATTTSDGRYEFTTLPTDDGTGTNGPGASYVVVVTDQNNVLAPYVHTVGTPNANNNSQAQPAYCVDLTNTGSDIQYADFGYADPTVDPTDPGSSGTNNEETLANTGQPFVIPVIAAITLAGTGITVLAIKVRKRH